MNPDWRPMLLHYLTFDIFMYLDGYDCCSSIFTDLSQNTQVISLLLCIYHRQLESQLLGLDHVLITLLSFTVDGSGHGHVCRTV